MLDTMSVAVGATVLGAVCSVATAFLQGRLLREKTNESRKSEPADTSGSNQSPELPAQLKPVRNSATDEMPVTTIIVDDGTGTHYQSVSIDNPDKKTADVILKEITDTLQKNAAVK